MSWINFVPAFRWCGPCKLLGPRLEKAVDEHEGKIILAKVDVDDLSEIAMQYKVSQSRMFVLPNVSWPKPRSLGD